MEDKKVTVNHSFPFFSILTLIFITLKLTGYITWSWLWVLSPLWIPISVLLCIVMLVIAGTIFLDKR